jgi:hypothetical protein
MKVMKCKKYAEKSGKRIEGNKEGKGEGKES